MNFENVTNIASSGGGAADFTMTEFLDEVANTTITGLASAVKESGSALLSAAMSQVASSHQRVVPHLVTSNGIGTQWLKSMLGRSEWTLPCLGIKVAI